MSFSLGGLIRGGISILAHSNPVTGTLYDAAASLAGSRRAAGGSGAADPLLLPPVTGGGVIRGGAPPGLPQLPAGVGPPGTSMVQRAPTDVRGADPSTYSTTKPHSMYGHYTRTGRWIKTNAKGKALRRMNPMNVHAARRAVRRIKSGEKLFRRIFRIMHHSKPGVAVKRVKGR